MLPYRARHRTGQRSAPRQQAAPTCTRRRTHRAPRADPSGHAELVALRVAQHDRVAPHVLVRPGDAGARLHQLLDLVADQPLALLAADLAPGHPDVEVNPVLGTSGLR